MALNVLVFGICFIAIACAYWWKSYANFSRMLDHIPGPDGKFLVGNALQIKNPRKLHKYFYKFAKQFGPVFKMRMINNYYIVLSDLETIRELYFTQGQGLAGRYVQYRVDHLSSGRGITSSQPTAVWKTLRKAAHRHLKQFGKGMNALEDLITEISEDMFAVIAKSEGSPFDPYPTIFETALKNLAFLIIGQRCQSGDILLQQMQQYNRLMLDDVTNFSRPEHALIDAFPWLKYVFRGTWKRVCRCVELQDIIWKEMKKRLEDQQTNTGLAALLLSHTSSPGFASDEFLFAEEEAKQASLDVFFAGMETTSHSFYAMVNILAHYPDVQLKLSAEITETIGQERNVSLDDRPNLPFARAVILELTRYYSIVQMSIPHRAVKDGIIIKGYTIPYNSSVTLMPNLHGLHHDSGFWGDPDVFRPERFLDEERQVVPADHPNRTHLMPFGSGPRVCLGESLALARLFLWTTNLVQRFKVTPAKGNDKFLATPDGYYCEGILYSEKYSVIFTRRS